MPNLLGAGTISALRGLFEDSLSHTCTRTPITQGSEDTWGDTADTAGTAVAGVDCRYSPNEVFRRDEAGRVLVSGPTLRVAAGETLDVGDRVSSIEDAAGTALHTGTLTVDEVEPVGAASGEILGKRALLTGARVSE